MPDGIGAEFMRRTRHETGPSPSQRGLPARALEMPWDRQARRVRLPGRGEMTCAPVDLTEAIERRRSRRQFSDAPLSLAELSYLLWCSQGVREVVDGRATLRTVPSAGARHALETVVLANRVEGLEAGLYRFVATRHELVAVDAPPNPAQRLADACLHQQFIARAAAGLIWVADAGRMTWRYRQRGYRYLHLDAGHVCQNLYLAAEAVGAAACAVGAFDDDALNRLLGLDGEACFVIYLAAVGKRC
jgi:SagB-type dehydrogenase family enzyme